tara:strand:+ start:217 stop:474 length:258 start_codon:yes stop_codon:yes gene_type:complete
MEKKMTNNKQDNLRAMSNVWNTWCEFNDAPKHENGNYYSADDIMINHYQELEVEPSTEQVKFFIAFRDVWETIQSIPRDASLERN